jgi:hypothetical protein
VDGGQLDLAEADEGEGGPNGTDWAPGEGHCGGDGAGEKLKMWWVDSGCLGFKSLEVRLGSLRHRTVEVLQGDLLCLVGDLGAWPVRWSPPWMPSAPHSIVSRTWTRRSAAGMS